MKSIFLNRTSIAIASVAAFCFVGLDTYNQRKKLDAVGNKIAPDVGKKTRLGRIESIQINPNSTVSSDLQAIWHNPDEAKVCVRFKPEARCPHPSLVGRISGQSVIKLQWSQVAPVDNSFTEYCGSYAHSWIDPGRFFLDIIIIHCNGFGITALERIQSQHLNPRQMGSSIDDWLEFDYVHECLEDSLHSRLTAKNAFISIDTSYPGIDEHHMGHWALSNHKPNTKPRPHYTRHQPVGCREEDPDWSKHKCQAAMNNSRIDELSFVWNREQQWSRELEKLQFDYTPFFNFTYAPNLEWTAMKEFHDNLTLTQNEAEEPPICFWGDSHSVHLWNSMLHLNLGHRFSIAGRSSPHWNFSPNRNLLYPNLTEAIDQAKWSYETFGCTTFILAVGQWTSSHQAWNSELYGHPFSFGRFYRDMSAIV